MQIEKAVGLSSLATFASCHQRIGAHAVRTGGQCSNQVDGMKVQGLENARKPRKGIGRRRRKRASSGKIPRRLNATIQSANCHKTWQE
eukprot:1449857-Rhodomonas_salina.2